MRLHEERSIEEFRRAVERRAVALTRNQFSTSTKRQHDKAVKQAERELRNSLTPRQSRRAD
jgi:hypothetical protein